MSAAGSKSRPVEIAYGYGRSLDLSFGEAVARAKEALKKEGFGVLCEIDIREKLREKLGVDFRQYVILGVCNPPIAYQSLQLEVHLGLLLPCNVIVYVDGDRSVVAAIDAARMLSIVGNPDLEAAAGQVNQTLRRAIDAL